MATKSHGSSRKGGEKIAFDRLAPHAVITWFVVGVSVACNVIASEAPTSPLVLEPAPVVVPPGAARAMERAREQLDAVGFIDKSTEEPNLDQVLRRVRDYLAGHVKLDQPQMISRIAEFDSARLPFEVGKVPPAYLTGKEESYIVLSPHRVMRVFADSKLGATLIQEQRGRLVDPAGTSDFLVAGRPVHVSRIRYANGRFATVMLSSDDTRSILLEVSRDTRSKADLDAAKQLMASLLTDVHRF